MTDTNKQMHCTNTDTNECVWFCRAVFFFVFLRCHFILIFIFNEMSFHFCIHASARSVVLVKIKCMRQKWKKTWNPNIRRWKCRAQTHSHAWLRRASGRDNEWNNNRPFCSILFVVHSSKQKLGSFLHICTVVCVCMCVCLQHIDAKSVSIISFAHVET